MKERVRSVGLRRGIVDEIWYTLKKNCSWVLMWSSPIYSFEVVTGSWSSALGFPSLPAKSRRTAQTDCSALSVTKHCLLILFLDSSKFCVKHTFDLCF